MCSAIVLFSGLISAVTATLFWCLINAQLWFVVFKCSDRVGRGDVVAGLESWPVVMQPSALSVSVIIAPVKCTYKVSCSFLSIFVIRATAPLFTGLDCCQGTVDGRNDTFLHIIHVLQDQLMSYCCSITSGPLIWSTARPASLGESGGGGKL